GDVPFNQPPPSPLQLAEDGSFFIDPPSSVPTPERPWQLDQLIRKFDPVERDFRNRELGKAGEAFVVDVERQKLINAERPDLARKIRWVAMEDGDGAGYDILSFEPGGRERLIEVKTTNGAAWTPFFLTRNEHQTAHARQEDWHLYRVHLFSQKPRICLIKPPLEPALHLRPETWRASFA
ncbi:DUF3883 domain-containing protein, partial [Rhizobiaceae sp. 2RAB30]